MDAALVLPLREAVYCTRGDGRCAVSQRRHASARLARLEAIARWTRWAERERANKPALVQQAAILELYLEAVNTELRDAGLGGAQ